MIHGFEFCRDKNKEVGEVVEVRNSLVRVVGLPGAVVGEGISFESSEHGMVLSLGDDFAEVLVLSLNPLSQGTQAARTGEQLTVSCGEGLLGHTVDAFGYTKDERRDKSDYPETRQILINPSGIAQRHAVTKSFATGVSIVDLIVPIGRGQRELVIGDRKSGKTHFLLQTMLAQAKEGHVCVYGAVGKKKEEIKAIEEFLDEEKIMDRCIIVAADAHDSPGEVYLAPYTAMTVAEYFRDKGSNVFLVLDDLSTHAKYYRELSLLGSRFPGRESYPGDIFHAHSQLLERAGSFNIDGKEATITCLPVAESIGGDITGYIQTNLMSMTDGHIYFDAEKFYKGIRPAVNAFLSVTRVGRQTQDDLLREVGKEVLSILRKHEDLQRFLRFGPDMSEDAQDVIRQGDALLSFFTQAGYVPVAPSLQAVLVALIKNNDWNGKNALQFAKAYNSGEEYKTVINEIVQTSKSFTELLEHVSRSKQGVMKVLEKEKSE